MDKLGYERDTFCKHSEGHEHLLAHVWELLSLGSGVFEPTEAGCYDEKHEPSRIYGRILIKDIFQLEAQDDDVDMQANGEKKFDWAGPDASELSVCEPDTS